MSLFKQLFIAILVLMLSYFIGSVVVTVESSREQQVSQLRAHAQDAATALGLSLSSHVDDPAMMELMVSSIFDSGYFDSIRVLKEPEGTRMFERSGIPVQAKAPGWFASLVRLQPAVADAYVSDGWQQAARVEVVSHPVFAIDRMWQDILGSLLWLSAMGGISLLLGALFLKRQLRPLDYLVEQSNAIARREFISSVQLPKTPEFRRVVGAMNQMADKLKTLFAEEAARSEKLHAEAYRDSLTGLANRRLFDQQLTNQLGNDDEAGSGYLLILQVGDLAELNKKMGGQRADALLADVAERLCDSTPKHAVLARTRGGEFSLMVPGLEHEEASQLAIQLLQNLDNLQQTLPQDCPLSLHIGITAFIPEDKPDRLYRQLDQALTLAHSKDSRSAWAFSDRSQHSPVFEKQRRHWHHLLDSALHNNRLQLFFQPVVYAANDTLWHHKVLVRLPGDHGQLLPAGIILPWLERFGWMPRLDLAMLDLAFQHLREHPLPVAISLSGQLLEDPASMQQLQHILEHNRALGRLITFELSEDQLPAQTQLEELARQFNNLGFGIALQHFGGRFSIIGNLAKLGLQYLKLDGSYIRAIDQQSDKKLFIEAVQRAAGSIDLPLIAERVETRGEHDVLKNLGIAGMQGQLFGEPAAWK